MRCMIVDDEKLALDLLENNIGRVPFLTLTKRCKNPFEAVSYLSESTVDLLFLDIQMPGITGVEMLQSLQNPPQVIMVSAYENYAVEGFNLDVTDYLVKPVSFDRFLKACNKAWKLFQMRGIKTDTEQRSYFFVNVEYKQVKIIYDQILYIEGMRDYVRIHLNNQRPVITHMSMKAVEEKLPSQDFLRIHKSYIANLSRIKTLKKGIALIDTREVPFSENYKEELSRKLGIRH